MANNCINLKGECVKNKGFIDRIFERLRTLHARFRKVKGHNGDQWNNRADALAVMDRNDAISWPKCSFEIVIESGRIPFRLRPTRPFWTITDLLAQLSAETEIKLPNYRDLAIYEEGRPSSSHRTPEHYAFSLKTLPPP
jgi:hypothetical protein